MQAPKTDSKPRELVPEGNHVARLYNIIYIGTVETPYMNDDGTKKEQYKVRLTFELPNEMREFGEGDDKKEKPMVISKEMTFSLYKGSHTAQLRTVAHALIGTALKDEEAENFDIDDLLGKACMVDISHEEYEGSKYAKAVTFSSVPKGLETPDQINESKVQSVHLMSREDIDQLPEFIRKKMTSSKEYDERMNATGTGKQKLNTEDDINPEDIPF